MNEDIVDKLRAGVWTENPGLVQLLGLCPLASRRIGLNLRLKLVAIKSHQATSSMSMPAACK